MGNRAVITTKENWQYGGVGVYLHWNGGRDSVEAFLKYCEIKGYRNPSADGYGLARLVQVIGNYFGGRTSVGVDTLWHLDCDNYDNGVYVIDGWKIVDRVFMRGEEQYEHDLIDTMVVIDSRQPKPEQLGKAYIRAEEVLVEDLRVGDEVYVDKWDGEIVKTVVIGIGANESIVNGHGVAGVPYVDLFQGGCENINNYLLKNQYKKV